MTQPLHILIVGAGIGGLACAIASLKEGLQVTILEKADSLAPIGAGIQIPPNASRIWSQYGLLDRLKEVSVVSRATQLRRWETGEVLVIHRADYQRVLVEEAKRLGVRLRLDAEVVDVDFDGTKVVLKDGKEIRGDVIVGADGSWSTLRSHLLGHDSPPQETGDLAYRGTFSREALLALRDSGVNELCEQNIVTMWIGPESHAVFYPVRSSNEFNLVMTRPDDLPPNIKTKVGDLEELKAIFEGWDLILTKILSAFSSNNFALLGDACHPSLPYQAQGAALAVEDGAIIATLLSLYQKAASLTSTRIPTLPETLQLYEEIQKTRTTTLHLGSISNQKMYHLDDGPEQEERDRILKAATWVERPEGKAEPFLWIDYSYQYEMLSRDAIGDARRKWVDRVQGCRE
ncbi:FAD/NAD(P)-binding domain-containing protein [Aaosphaeria arxii CBS 175.79]|uniref:FAD/NAD(P)-binding domain-containing protein n=1 Tax=Aaosphaeria arxii CBS 175.79 TaxID=1450172 RepID=A0A6A5YAX2_9PLEO|nr:FAD/NAD(P)-binding domain-containing protein [Aaosphaeria arxii CBS 175.79]KAF2022177.1 FAD/NAD(P)-binding domain-containing protein [Aaosphaeria arxii CBS 175.79]